MTVASVCLLALMAKAPAYPLLPLPVARAPFEKVGVARRDVLVLNSK